MWMFIVHGETEEGKKNSCADAVMSEQYNAMWWVNNTMSEKCDGSTRQVEDERHERGICEFLYSAKRRHIASEKDA